MERRLTTFVRMMRLALILWTLVFGLGGLALVTAGPTHAAPTPGPFDATQSLLARLALSQVQLTAADGAAEDCFGCSVAVSGDTAVVGSWQDNFGSSSFQGSAYVFVRSGTVWSQQAKLTAADGAADDRFGSSVAISGNTVAVGVPFDDDDANPDEGSAYVFVRSGTVWSQQAKLTAADGAADDRFGSSVGISGNTVVVGAPFDDVGDQTNRGSVYAFVRSGSTWSQQAKLTAADGAGDDRFGSSVAISGDTVVAGAPFDYGGQGTATVFTRSGSTWTRQLLRDELMGADDDYFGYSVAISGDIAVVGAYCDDVYSDGQGQKQPDQGTATVFARSGSTWSLERRLIAADGAAYDCLGYSVAVSGNTAVAGAVYDNVGTTVHQGSARVFSGVVALPGRPLARSPKGLISSRTPTFRWGFSGAATYQVRVYRGSSLIRTKAGITKLSWKCTKPLPRGVWLTWKVRAVNAAGAGPWSAKPRFKVR